MILVFRYQDWWLSSLPPHKHIRCDVFTPTRRVTTHRQVNRALQDWPDHELRRLINGQSLKYSENAISNGKVTPSNADATQRS